jgi:RNA polymerase sigma factor (sigma-70 family)
MADWHDTMEQLVRDRERALLGYAYLVCGNASHAQDLVQDALVRTFSRPRADLSVYQAEAYVRRAITSAYVDSYRRRQRWARVQHLFGAGPHEDDLAAHVDMNADVSAAVAALPPRERASIILRYFDDLTVPQIAAQLGLAEGSVKRYLSDGIDRLERSLGPLDDDAEETAPVVERR